MKLYKHQQVIVSADPKKIGLFLGTGSGKTRIALLLARGKTLVICPKTQKEDGNWEREAKEIGVKGLTIISKEVFRRDHEVLGDFDTVIVDESHTCLGVTPNTRQRKRVVIPKTSQLYEALNAYITRAKPERVYLCTATILRSPMTVWGAAQVLGKAHAVGDFYAFRREYYTQLPMPGRDVWVPKSDNASKNKLAAIVRVLGYVGRLEDYFDVPYQSYHTDYIELTAEQKKIIKDLYLEYPEPIVRVGKRHQVENGVLAGDEFSKGETFTNNKISKILDYVEEFDKLVIFAKYRAQIEAIRRAVEGKRPVFVLTGDTKDRGELLKQANNASQGVFICQAQISSGW